MNWEQTYNEHGRALLLFARQWADSLPDAEDLVQEGFLKVFRAGDSIAGERIVPALYNAVRWAGLDRLRSRIRRQKREEAATSEPVVMFESTLENDERRAEIERTLTRLPDEQREVLVMKIWGGLAFREIGEALDISQNTAASRYRYALEGLRRVLKREVVGHG